MTLERPCAWRGAEQATFPDVPITMHGADDRQGDSDPVYKMEGLVARLVLVHLYYISKDEEDQDSARQYDSASNAT